MPNLRNLYIINSKPFKKLPFILIAILLTQNLWAQKGANKVSGTVADSLSKKPIGFATASLLSKDKKLLSVSTDSTGKFLLESLKAGEYRLELSSVGYEVSVVPITLTNEKPSLVLGTILLKEDSKQLKNITVTAQKALVEDKGDRLVYNAEKDITNTGGTAADVLRKVPTLTVDLNGSVQMRGNSNIKVLVNGKPSAMMARNLADALRQMPASVIKTVEVITSPGAKYDAEGAAGIINIITKKGLKGFNGSANLTAGNMNRSIGTSLNLKEKKFGISFSGTGYQFRNIFESSSSRTSLQNGAPINILTQSSKGDNVGTGGYGELAVDYDPDSLSHLNFSANVWGGNYPNNTTIENRLTDGQGALLQAFTNDRRFKNPYGNGQLDLGYTKSFKKQDQEFSFLTQFSRMPDNYFYTTDRYAPGDEIIYREQSTNYSRNKEYTVQSDYTHPFVHNGKKDTTSIKLEVGIKAIIRDIGSEVHVERSLDGKGELISDPSQDNNFDYIQKVYSGYMSLRLSNKHRWNLNLGARMEHTDIHGKFITTNTNLDNKYNNLIPSFLLSKAIKSHNIKISYTQRITRPLIWYLNPWVNQSDPKNLSTGTPTLNPELNHAMELAHGFNTPKGFSLNTAVYYRLTNNAIEYLSRVDTAGITLSKPENIATRKNLGTNINVSSKPTKNWSLNGGLDVRYVDLRSTALNQSNDGIVWNVNINSTYNLPKDYTVQMYGGTNSGWVSLQRTNSKFYWYGLSAKHQFWDKKASLTLGVNNPFSRGVDQTATHTGPGFITTSESLFVNRSVRLTFEWRFGQMSTSGGRQGKKIKNDDSGR